MTIKEATNAINTYLHDKVGIRVGRNYKDFYCFFVAPEGSNPSDRTFVGNMILIRKEDEVVLSLDDLDNETYESIMKERWEPIYLDDDVEF